MSLTDFFYSIPYLIYDEREACTDDSFQQTDSCKPAQWVPQEWCFKQFFNMCVNLGKGGKVRAKYGKGGCQDWHIKKF